MKYSCTTEISIFYTSQWKEIYVYFGIDFAHTYITITIWIKCELTKVKTRQGVLDSNCMTPNTKALLMQLKSAWGLLED